MNTPATLTLQGKAVKIIRFKGCCSCEEFSHENKLKPRHHLQEKTLHMRKHCVALEIKRATAVEESSQFLFI